MVWNLPEFIGIFQAWSLFGQTETFFVSIVYFVLKWLPGIFIQKIDKNTAKAPKRIVVEVTNMIFHPVRLSWKLAYDLWNPSKENQLQIQELHGVRGCLESPILLIIQLWLVFYGLTQMTSPMKWSSLTFKDWEGNEFYLPFLRPISILTSLATILRSTTSLENIELKNFTPFIIIFNGIYFHILSIVISMTYLNNFGLVAPFIALCTNVVSRLFDGKVAIKESITATLLPMSKNGILEDLIKTLLYTFSLVMVLIVVNVPFEMIGFVYGEHCILDNLQVNFLVGCLFCHGFMSFLCQHLNTKHLKITLALANFILILASIVALWMHNTQEKFGYLTYQLASNHSVSVRGIVSTPLNKNFCGRLFSNPDTMYPNMVSALKVTTLTQLEQMQDILPILSLAVVKMKNPYLPAKPYKSQHYDFPIIYISPKDWPKVPNL